MLRPGCLRSDYLLNLTLPVRRMHGWLQSISLFQFDAGLVPKFCACNRALVSLNLDVVSTYLSSHTPTFSAPTISSDSSTSQTGRPEPIRICRLSRPSVSVVHADFSLGMSISAQLSDLSPRHSSSVESLQINRREQIMSQSRGDIRFQPLFTTADIGLREDANVEHVVKVFLNVGEASVARWIEMPRGILLLQTVPDQSASGAIYLYDRELHIFYFVDFVEGRDDNLTPAEFDQLVVEYDLVSWTANPGFLPASIGKPGMA